MTGWPAAGRVRTCVACARAFPEVDGAPEQVCPHCGATMPTGAARPSGVASSGAVDPAGAAAHAFRFTRAHYGPLLMLWVPALVVDLAGSLALVGYQASQGLDDLTTLSLAEQLAYLGLAFPILLAVYGVRLAVWSLTAAYVADHEGASGRLAALRARLPAALGLGALLALTYLSGLVLLVVPFVVFYHWFLFAPAAFATDAAGPGAALDASRRFARERRTLGFTALSLFVLGGVVLAWLILSSLALGLFGAVGWSSAALDAVVMSLLAWLVAPIAGVLPASYYVLAQRAPAPVAVDPKAPPADRFRTTKCPGCGTLVPYTATGAPVEVACPVCGRTGKVL